MKRVLFLLPLVLIMFVPALANPAPEKSSFGERFIEANRLMEENFWGEAVKEWRLLLEEQPNNANVNYKLGYSLLQTTNAKAEALQYLEIATSKKVSKNYDPFDPMERRAPLDALYYLGVAQHLNYKFDEAIETFNKLKRTLNKKHAMYGRADQQILIAEEAKKQMSSPVEYVITNLGPVVNSVDADFSPVLSLDEASLFFTSRRMRPDSTNSRNLDPGSNEFRDDIYFSFRDADNQWSAPELLNLNSDEHDATISVSPDGQMLFIYQDSLGDGQIKSSKLIGEIWSDPALLGSDINTPYWETHATISADGSTLFFVSNRPGGYGGRDIYRSVKLPNGEWSRALNVGPTINTAMEEDCPFLTPDGKIIFFASQGHQNMGGFDLFRSRLGEDGEWGKPENLGYPLNTVEDDVFFVPMADGKRAYYSSQKDGGYGKQDIYLVDMPQGNESQLAVLKGFIIGEDGKELPADLKIVIINMKSGEKMEYKPRQRDGGYLAILNPCTNYHIDYYQGRDVIKTDDILVPCESNFQELEREVYLIPVSLGKTEPVVELPKEEPKKEEPKKEEPKKEAPKTLEYDANDPIKNQYDEELGYAEFSRYFVYDSKDFGSKEVKFQFFADDVEKIIKKNGDVIITVEASASKVPSSKFKSNMDLASFRNESARKMIADELTKRGYKEGTNFTFGEPVKLVQGKEYAKDADENKAIYEQFQYIKIKVEG